MIKREAARHITICFEDLSIPNAISGSAALNDKLVKFFLFLKLMMKIIASENIFLIKRIQIKMK